MQPVSTHKPSKVFYKFFAIFTGLAFGMHMAVAPNIKFETEKTIVPVASSENNESKTMAAKIFQFFSYEKKPVMKFYFKPSAWNIWIATIPSIFFAVSIIELSQLSESEFNFGTNWRFIIIGSWWVLQLSVYLMKSIRELSKILIIFYIEPFQWNSPDLHVLIVLIYLKVVASVIMFRIIRVAKNKIKLM